MRKPGLNVLNHGIYTIENRMISTQKHGKHKQKRYINFSKTSELSDTTFHMYTRLARNHKKWGILLIVQRVSESKASVKGRTGLWFPTLHEIERFCIDVPPIGS